MHQQLIPLEGTWSLGVLIGGPIAALLILVGLGALVLFIVMQHSGGDAGGLIGGAVVYLVVVVGWVAAPAVGFYPYNAEYHKWYEKSGEVAQIDNRLIGSGDGMETKFVIRFAGGGGQYGCDDTRCAQVREGDRLTLSCKRAWQYTGTDGYDCRFVSTESVR